MSRGIRAVAVITAAAALALAACGGSSGPSKADYSAKANTICKSVVTQTAPLINQLKGSITSLVTGGGAGVKAAATGVARLHTIAAADLAKLKALAQPSGDHAAIQKFLTPLTSVVKAIGQAASSLAKGSVTGALLLLQQVQPLVGQVTSAAHAYGLGKCSQILALG